MSTGIIPNDTKLLGDSGSSATAITPALACAETALSTPEEFGKLIEAEIQRWGKLVRALKLKAE